jgi:uncharacterized protein
VVVSALAGFLIPAPPSSAVEYPDEDLADERPKVPRLPILNASLPLTLGWLAAVLVASSQAPLVGLLVALGFVGGLVSGLVGVGGGVLMIPMLILVPSLVGMAPIDVRVVTGIAAAQVMAGSLSGLGGHMSEGAFDRRLFVAVGPVMAAASLVGALVSAGIEPQVVKGVYAAMAIVAAALLLFIRPTAQPARNLQDGRRLLAALVGGVIGLPAGMVGVGGAFLLIPILVHGFRLDMRVVLGTSLAIVALSAAATLTGKVLTGQVDWVLAFALISGALPAGRIGAALSHRIPTQGLSTGLGLLVLAVGVRLLADAVR